MLLPFLFVKGNFNKCLTVEVHFQWTSYLVFRTFFDGVLFGEVQFQCLSYCGKCFNCSGLPKFEETSTKFMLTCIVFSHYEHPFF